MNQTDAMTILSSFGSLEQIINASESKLCDCVGFGTRKAMKLHKTLHEPFLKKPGKKSPKKTEKPNLKRAYTNALDDKEIDRCLMDVVENKD